MDFETIHHHAYQVVGDIISIANVVTRKERYQYRTKTVASPPLLNEMVKEKLYDKQRHVVKNYYKIRRF